MTSGVKAVSRKAGLSQGHHWSGIIPWMHPTNERRCYIVMLSLIGWVHSQNDLWLFEVSLLHSYKMIFSCVDESEDIKMCLHFGPLQPVSDHKYIFYGFPPIINGMRSLESPFSDKPLICKEHYVGANLVWNEQIKNGVGHDSRMTSMYCCQIGIKVPSYQGFPLQR